MVKKPTRKATFAGALWRALTAKRARLAACGLR